MIGAYAVRKLVEAETKVPQAVRNQKFEVDVIPLRDLEDGSLPDLMNWHHIHRWYDFDKQWQESLPLVDLCNQVIHSWIFVPVIDEDSGGLDSVLVSSDRQRKKCLYGVPAGALVQVFRSVGEAEVMSLSMQRDADGQWIVREAL